MGGRRGGRGDRRRAKAPRCQPGGARARGLGPALLRPRPSPAWVLLPLTASPPPSGESGYRRQERVGLWQGRARGQNRPRSFRWQPPKASKQFQSSPPGPQMLTCQTRWGGTVSKAAVGSEGAGPWSLRLGGLGMGRCPLGRGSCRLRSQHRVVWSAVAGCFHRRELGAWKGEVAALPRSAPLLLVL